MINESLVICNKGMINNIAFNYTATTIFIVFYIMTIIMSFLYFYQKKFGVKYD